MIYRVPILSYCVGLLNSKLSGIKTRTNQLSIKYKQWVAHGITAIYELTMISSNPLRNEVDEYP